MTATRDPQWPERAVFRFFVCGPSTSLKTRSAIFPLEETHLDGQVFSKMAGILFKKFNFTDWPQINLGSDFSENPLHLHTVSKGCEQLNEPSKPKTDDSLLTVVPRVRWRDLSH